MQSLVMQSGIQNDLGVQKREIISFDDGGRLRRQGSYSDGPS